MTGRGGGPDAGDGQVPDDPQWERAHRAWSLYVDVDPSALSQSRRKALFRALRAKRSEHDHYTRRLPGVVRAGARIDLAPLEARLREAGFPCALQRTPPASPDA